MRSYAGCMGLSERVRIYSPPSSCILTWQLLDFCSCVHNVDLSIMSIFTHVIVYPLYYITDEDYVLQFVHPFNRLELLRAQSPCPEAITLHVQQLSGAAD